MKKFANPVAPFGWLFVASLVSSPAQVGEEIGIDRSNLTRESEMAQEKTLQDIHALHATWFRDVLSGTTPETVAKFVNKMRWQDFDGYISTQPGVTPTVHLTHAARAQQRLDLIRPELRAIRERHWCT